ncbi:MAG: redox-sensing transcriptional repressor Rex [Firmicutes bacterium]|nr:redox-sensing transcriptional repressor Rex [Bacillota bacterium]
MKKIPKPALERLFIYYRVLLSAEQNGETVISSVEMGKRLDLDPAQIRKDLTYCGEFGKPRIGYRVDRLKNELKNILGLEEKKQAVIIGVGRLGMAIYSYPGFAKFGLEIVGLFDNDPTKVGLVLGGEPIRNISELGDFIREKRVPMGILTVPAPAAQRVADIMVDAGICAIWNFAPVTLKVPDRITVRNEDLAVGLATLSWNLLQSGCPYMERNTDTKE